jgi:hypothetical protein
MRDTLGRRFDPSFIALSCHSFSLQLHGSDSISSLQYHSWFGFAHQLDLCIGHHFTTSWNSTWQAPLALRSRITKASAPPSCCLATPTRIGEIAVHSNRHLVRPCCSTTRRRSFGGRRCRRLRLSQRQRPNTTIPHLRLVLRDRISELFCNDLASVRRRPHLCTRTTPRASDGETTSSADGNKPH